MSSACSVPPAQHPTHPLPTSPQELPHPSPPSPISYEGRVSVLPPNASLQLEASSGDNSVLRFSTAPSTPLLAGRESGRSHSSEGYPHFKGVHDFVAEGNDFPLYSPPRNKNTMVFNQNMHAHNYYKLQQQQQQHLGFPHKYDSSAQERKSPPWENHQAKMVTPPRSTPSNTLYNTHNTPNDSGISPGTGASISPAATGTSDEGNPQFKSGFLGKVKMEPDMEANRTESESPVSDAGHFSDERQPDDDASSRFSGYRGDPMDDDEDMEEDEIMEGHEGQASDALSRLQRALEHSGVLRSVYTGGNNDETSADDGHQAEVYQCQLCSYSGTSKFHFSAHLNTHFDLKCTQCDFTARTESKLRAHMKTSHDSMEDGEQEPGVRVPRVNAQGKVKTFKCKQCNFVAVTKLDFWEHSRTHIKAEKLLTCSKCPFVTEYKHHLEYHLRNHFGSKPFKCPKCNYSCVNKSMLNSHMKSHSNVYQYRCSDCTYATKYCHSLKLHLRKYSHKPSVVLNSDGTPNHVPVIDVYGTRRGPKKKDGSGSTSSNNSHGSGGDAPVRNSATSPAASNPPNPSPMPFLGLNPFPHLNGHPYGFPFGLLGQSYSDSLLQDKSSSLARDNKESSPARERPTPDTCEPLKCTLCDFVTNSRETLSQHLVRHATSENRDLASLFGIHSHHDNNSQRTESRSSRKVPSVSNPTPSPPSHQPDTQMAATAPAVKEYLSRMFANPLLFAPGLTQGSMHNPLLRPRLPIKEERQTPPTPLTSPPLSPVSTRPRNSAATTVPLDLSREGVNTPPLHAGSPQEQREKPAKNRRKGQAFKLERIAVRLQERQSPPDSTSTSPAPQDQEEDFEKLDGEEKVESKTEIQWGGAYSCGFCDIAFKDVVMYTMHMGYHGYQDPFTCNMCGQQTHDKLAFFLHIARSSHA